MYIYYSYNTDNRGKNYCMLHFDGLWVKKYVVQFSVELRFLWITN